MNAAIVLLKAQYQAAQALFRTTSDEQDRLHREQQKLAEKIEDLALALEKLGVHRGELDL